MIAWTIEVAITSGLFNRVIVSTDDTEIAETSRAWGAEVPFLRPAVCASDSATDLAVYNHALKRLDEDLNLRPDVVVWLRPTSPLRLPIDISGCLAVLKEKDADCVRSITVVDDHPYWMKRLEDGWLRSVVADHDETRYPRRQLLPLVFRLNGAVDVVRCARVRPDQESLFGGNVAGYMMPANRSVDIDSPEDLALAEQLLAMNPNEKH